MTPPPHVSIVLPTLNGASRFLGTAIRSCLDQTRRDFELIVVDDGSTDGTAALVGAASARDARVRMLRSERNEGLPAALNRGFRAAGGELLTWTSDDNLFRPNAIELMARTFQDHPGVDFVYAGYTVIDGTGRPTETVAVSPPEGLAGRNVVGPCFMYRRRVLTEVGEYDREAFLAEDYDFWLRVASRFCLTRLPDDLYLYRRHERTLTAERRADMVLMTEKVLARHLRSLPWATGRVLAASYLQLAVRARRRRALHSMLGYLWLGGRSSIRALASRENRGLLAEIALGAGLARAVQGLSGNRRVQQ